MDAHPTIRPPIKRVENISAEFPDSRSVDRDAMQQMRKYEAHSAAATHYSYFPSYWRTNP